jgi:transposase
MRKIKEVLRLKHEHGLNDRQIALICGIARSTVGEYLMRARAAGITWPPEGDGAAIEAQLFADRQGRPKANEPRPMPDFAEIHAELQSHKHLTLQLVWEEYKQAHPDGYQYSQFCDLYRRWAGKLDLVLRQSHRTGEKLFVDYAGQTVPVLDLQTGEVNEASIFVAVMGATGRDRDQRRLLALSQTDRRIDRRIRFRGRCSQQIAEIPDRAFVVRGCR